MASAGEDTIVTSLRLDIIINLWGKPAAAVQCHGRRHIERRHARRQLGRSTRGQRDRGIGGDRASLSARPQNVNLNVREYAKRRRSAMRLNASRGGIPSRP